MLNVLVVTSHDANESLALEADRLTLGYLEARVLKTEKMDLVWWHL